MSLRPDRASSYNNVLTSADGGVANVEGSATDAEVTGLDDDDHLVHTNHYVCDRMLPFEGDPVYAARSAVRYERARELIAAQAPRLGHAGRDARDPERPRDGARLDLSSPELGGRRT